MKTVDQILTETCTELALLLVEQSSELMTTESQAHRWKLKKAIETTVKIYTQTLTGVN